jgi:glycosyltransferase involved in cell wall biosynthesis
LPEVRSDGLAWPRLSIVTPSYNQAQFLEETIRSVLLQGYPNLEYIVIDGGSTDGSLEILRKYEKWLSYWVSEPDLGQTYALEKGFRRAIGEIVAWINSDDSYLPGALGEYVLELARQPELVMVYGDCQRVDEAGKRINTWVSRQTSVADLLLNGNQIPQQAAFMRAAALTAVGGVERELHYVMDYTLWLRLGLAGRILYRPGLVANFRKHPTSKGTTAGYAFIQEELNWLPGWAGLDKTLNEEERAEMFRRKQVTAALYAVLEDKVEQAGRHFNAALQNGKYPYGDGNALALKIVNFGGMGGSRILDSWENYKNLMLSIQRIQSHPVRRTLKGRVAALYHLAKAFRSIDSGTMGAARLFLLKTLWYSPRQLKKQTFRDALRRAFLFSTSVLKVHTPEGPKIEN